MDGLVVTRPGPVVAVLSVDCVPIILYHPARHVGAVVHVGWRGTAAGIAARAVDFLHARCGCDPSELRVGLGPSIGPCCYQVSRPVAEEIAAGFAYSAPVVAGRHDSWWADLASANRQQLLARGVPAANLEAAGLCTACHSRAFFSERKLG